jgi:hypothetical protein
MGLVCFFKKEVRLRLHRVLTSLGGTPDPAPCQGARELPIGRRSGLVTGRAYAPNISKQYPRPPRRSLHRFDSLFRSSALTRITIALAVQKSSRAPTWPVRFPAFSPRCTDVSLPNCGLLMITLGGAKFG